MNALRRGVLVALMGLFVALPVLARPGGEGGGGPGRMPSAKQLDRLADEIGIDAATKEKLKAQIGAAREAGKAKHEAVKAARPRPLARAAAGRHSRSQRRDEADRHGG
jgi:hypothetical protein